MTDGRQKSTVCFADKLAGLCGVEASAAKNDSDRIADMIERLTNALAFTITIASSGDPHQTNTLVEGAIAYLLETSTQHQKSAGLFRNEDD